MTFETSKPKNGWLCWPGQALLAIAAFLLFSIVYSHIRPAMGRFGDAAMGRAYATIVCAFLIPALVFVGQLLVCIGTKSKKLRFPGWLMTGLTAVALSVLLCSVVYSMRPVPVYNPQNYQHLVGQHLRDAREQLDCKHAVSGAGSEDGKSCRFLSLRGMELVANSDGIIIEVKKGLRD